MESRIFRAQRSLGYVCNDIPLQTRYIGKHRDTFIITVVGRRFYTYSATKLHLYSISEFHPSDIKCLSVDNKYVYTACREDVRIFRRGVEADFVHPIANVRLLMPFGSHVVAVAGNDLIVFELESGERHLEIPISEASFKISCITHPVSYMNKILLGSEQGPLHLWNINDGQKKYEFAGWRQSVTCLQQHTGISPLDIVAIGLINGDIMIHNIKTDQTLQRFHQDWGTVTGITFR
ncbi:putative WD repeat-containing protein 36, partial [Hypsibius exemplaris]